MLMPAQLSARNRVAYKDGGSEGILDGEPVPSGR